MKIIISLIAILGALAVLAAQSEPPPAFVEYDVPNIGRVIGHDGAAYIVRTASGTVVGYPAASGQPSEANAAADIAAAKAAPKITPAPHRVLKDTIVLRVKAAGKLTELSQLISTLPAADQFEFAHSTWFSSNNPQLIAAASALGLDPAVILAVDPLAP